MKRGPAAGWDNTPRRGDKAIVMTGADPEYFQSELSSLIDEQLIKPSTDQLVFINAWNEWAEGNRLEPDTLLGRKYLEATGRALKVYE